MAKSVAAAASGWAAAVLSILVCLTATFFWTVSGWWGQDVQVTTTGHTIFCACAFPDGLHLLRSTNRLLQPPGWSSTHFPWTATQPPPPAWPGTLGFAWLHHQDPIRGNRPPIVTSELRLPYWAVVGATILL